MHDGINIDIFSKNDDFAEDFENDFLDSPATSASQHEDADDDAQKYEDLRKATTQLFFCICTLFEAVQACATGNDADGEQIGATPDASRSPEFACKNQATPWWAWANLCLSGVVLLFLFVSLTV